VEDRLLKEAFDKVRKEMTKKGECPDEVTLCRFAEGLMDEQETERMEAHLVSCPTCCDYVIALNRVINFPVEEKLPEAPDEQIKKVSRACMLEAVKGKTVERQAGEGIMEQITRFFKDMFSFDWLMQPLPVMVRSGVAALLLILVVSAGYMYYQQVIPIGIQMEVTGNTRVITRGVPTDERIEKIVKEGDILFSDDYCRINFKLDKDAYVYVLHHDSKGALHQLYPDPAMRDLQKAKGKTTHTIPEGKDNWFQLDDHSGKETIFLLASNKPIRDLNATIIEIGGLGREEVAKKLEGKARVLQVLNFEHR
jgi:hypothetical protein